MARGSKEPEGVPGRDSVSLIELIRQHVRIAIETAVHEELLVALEATPCERSEARHGHRSAKGRMLTGPSGPVVACASSVAAALV